MIINNPSINESVNTTLASIAQDVKAIIVCTQAEYDALTPDAETLYLISG